jgi:outer membrane autotransporter protein
VAALAAWCPTSFAQQACVAGCTVITGSPGVTQGVAMTGGGTMNVGVVGGPEVDIFTNNSSGGNVTNPALFAITTDASNTHTIIFNTTSNVFGAVAGTAGQVFASISGGNNGTALTFFGAVTSTQTLVTGTGSINFNSGSANTSAVIFQADGTLSLAPNTSLTGAVTTTAGAQTGTLVLGGGSSLTGAVGGAVGLKAINVVGGSATTGVSASITGATNAFTFNLGPNTLNNTGAVTFANAGTGGVINTTLNSTSVFGNIKAPGFQANFGPTTTVNVAVTPGAFIPVGSLFNIVQASAQNVSTVVTVSDPSNPLFKFSAVPASGTLAGLLTIQVTAIPLLAPVAPPAGVALPPASAIAGPVVTALLGTPLTPDLITVLGAISALTTPGAVVNAVAQLAPSSADLAAPLVTFQNTRLFQDLYSSRLDDVLCGEVNQRDRMDGDTSTCRGNDPHSGWWLKGFGQFGGQGTQGAYPGYDSQVFGTMVGLDAPIGDAPLGQDTRVGLGIGYAHTSIDGRSFSDNTDFNTAQVTGYIGHEQGPWFVQGDVSFGWNDYTGTRNISFPGFFRSAHAAYSGQDYTSFMTTGYHVAAGRFTITPLASLQYTHVSLGNYAETGAGDIDLKVRSQEYDFLESGLGVKVAHPFGFHDGFANPNGTYVPEVHFKWLHELYNPTLTNVAAFAPAGSPLFAAPGIKTADDTLNLGAGLTFLSCACSAKTWSLEAVYDYDWRADNYAAHQVMVKFTSRF